MQTLAQFVWLINKTIIKVATTGLLAVILVGAAIKLKLMGGTQ